MSSWTVVAPGVHQYRGGPFDLSTVVVEGDDGVLVVDSGGDAVEGAAILAAVRDRFDRPILGLVNTHAHFDHTFGNQAFLAAGEDVAIHGHAAVARHFEHYEGPRLAAWRADPSREPDRSWADVQLVAPTHPVDEPVDLDLGGRTVRLLPQTPAHSDTDLVLFVHDVRVWIVGDLVEESGPPMYGSGSYPLTWPSVLDALVAEMRVDDLVVPGHGAVVDRGFVAEQARVLRVIADRLAAAHAQGVPAGSALAEHADWPLPVAGLTGAVERAYLALDGHRLDEGGTEDA
ncbi:MBL fold metallo-hydrolase [Agromyces sp. NPDC058110]|uniref:MBL fold metallo-hydrolase n=1 Tax=Agromyces sp. NPDC058110 TaxID=3346345 RepID=UPI0036DDA58B